jgi:hypothetical protein
LAGALFSIQQNGYTLLKQAQYDTIRGHTRRYDEIQADTSRYEQVQGGTRSRYEHIQADNTSRYEQTQADTSRHEYPISKLLFNERGLCTVLPFPFFFLLMPV